MTEPDWTASLELQVRNWEPRQQLTPPVTEVEQPAFPVIDVHNHLGRWLSAGDWRTGSADWMVRDVSALVELMDRRRVRTVVNLDGMWGDEVTANIKRYDAAHPGRFLTFCHLDWSLLTERDGVNSLVRSLRDSVARGARGLKVWKTLGLHYRDDSGELVRPNDNRMVEVLQYAGELGIPVLIHTADPKAFFDPVDNRNERVEELAANRDWWFGDESRFPSFTRLLEDHADLVLRTPGTTFIGAHVGCAAEDLDRVEQLLDAAPNYFVDTADRLGEIGRQPRRFRAFAQRNKDRVLFGSDIYPARESMYKQYFRFFETQDEAFDYDPDMPTPQKGRWTISAVDLDNDTLRNLYHDNAARLFGGHELLSGCSEIREG